ncbi:MAG: hypothetical protein WCV43_05345 [Candidatus Caldatribacteriota bacterium]|jgi:hypothetical protein|nr:hypothetical protein [Atribacterota bacterium]MDD3031556.1 hypothetical protein [Atribacterota bacterium]MDD3641685.1 hypothetical protein [Atribacterota bacterium]MDD4288702.1 hypothetical protein [Atribacterota bacterium]MDI9596597.1 hypothetical protein [Atribacterota bacterium]
MGNLVARKGKILAVCISQVIIFCLLMLLISGCDDINPPANEGDTEQSPGESVETSNNPGPAPNSGDGVSDGPGWEKSLIK